MIYYIEHDSPLGTLLLATSEQGLCGIYFEEHRHFKGKGDWQHQPSNRYLQQAALQLDEYFKSTRKTFDVPLDIHGTEFQCKVWRALSNIQFGEVITYTELANRLGNTKAVRAISTAIGKNPISIIVPCHRVIGVSGALTGYAGGLGRKQFLLAHEAQSH